MPALLFSSFSLPQRCGAVTFQPSEQNAIQLRMLGKKPNLPEHLSAKSSKYTICSQLQVGGAGRFQVFGKTSVQAFTNLLPTLISMSNTEAYLCYLCIL